MYLSSVCNLVSFESVFIIHIIHNPGAEKGGLSTNDDVLYASCYIDNFVASFRQPKFLIFGRGRVSVCVCVCLLLVVVVIGLASSASASFYLEFFCKFCFC